MKYDAIIFDLDGTLWNANQSCTDAWNTFLEENNYPERISVKSMDDITGTPMDYAIDVLLPGKRNDHGDIKNILSAYEQIVVGKNGGDIYPDVLNGINELSLYFKIFIVSNCEEWYLHKFIEFSGLGPLLTGYDCHGSSGVEKYLMIEELKNKHELKKVVYIGDTVHDRKAAELSHSDFVQMTYGLGNPISDCIQCKTFRELLELLKA
jgi:phosphoglycolate phosphatase